MTTTNNSIINNRTHVLLRHHLKEEEEGEVAPFNLYLMDSEEEVAGVLRPFMDGGDFFWAFDPQETEDGGVEGGENEFYWKLRENSIQQPERFSFPREGEEEEIHPQLLRDHRGYHPSDPCWLDRRDLEVCFKDILDEVQRQRQRDSNRKKNNKKQKLEGGGGD